MLSSQEWIIYEKYIISMNAYQYLIQHRQYLPYNVGKDHKGVASNSDIRRILNNHGVVINGQRPTEKDEIEFPVVQLVFFPNGNTVTFL